MSKKFNLAQFEDFLKAARIPWKQEYDYLEIGDARLSVTVRDPSVGDENLPAFLRPIGKTCYTIDYINHNERQAKRFCRECSDMKKVGQKLNEAVNLLIQKGVTRSEVSK